jgi:hypothetical protein
MSVWLNTLDWFKIKLISIIKILEKPSSNNLITKNYFLKYRIMIAIGLARNKLNYFNWKIKKTIIIHVI